MKYEIDLHIFAKKLNSLLLEKELVDKKGNADPIKLYNLLYPNDKITEDMLKLDRQGATDKTRNIRNWIQGKNYPKSIKDILLLCNALDCDLDYFFTDMECHTHDDQFIQDRTQLSKKSIQKICSTRGHGNIFLEALISSQHYFEIDRLYEQVLNAIRHLNSCKTGIIGCENKAKELSPDTQEYTDNDKFYFELQHSAMRWDSESKTNVYDMGRIFLNIFEDIRKAKIK